MNIEEAKRMAAERAVLFVSSGSVIGLGTGSTMRHVLEVLARRLAAREIVDVSGVPTSEATASLAVSLGIPLTTLDEHPDLALTIDGADEIDPSLNLIKGLGGALLREKIVASASAELVIVADERKLVTSLGSRSPIPVEVVPFGLPVVLRRLSLLPGRVELRRGDDGEPFMTDEGHRIVDYHSGPIANPAKLDGELLRIPGVIDHGLFLSMAGWAVVAGDGGVRIIERPRLQ